MSLWEELGEILDKAKFSDNAIPVEEGGATDIENALMGKFGLSISELRLARKMEQMSKSLRPYYQHKNALLWVLTTVTGVPQEMIEASRLLEVFCLGMAYEFLLMEG